MIKYFDLNLGVNSKNHLTIVDALKELLANAKDEHVLNNIQEEIIQNYDTKNKIYKIENKGPGIVLDDFKCGKNPKKQNNNDIIGQFGYGLKDAIAILFKNDCNIEIKTKTLIMKPVSKCKFGTNVKTIHIEYKEHKLNYDFGTQINISNIDEKYVDAALEKFIPNYKENKIYNDMYLCDEFQNIFMNGMLVHEKTGHYFTYNIKKTKELEPKINRDRTEIKLIYYNKPITDILKNINIFANAIITNKFIEILKAKSKKDLKEFKSTKIIHNILTQLNLTNKYIFVDEKERIIQFSDKIPVIIGLGILRLLVIDEVKNLCEFPKNTDIKYTTITNIIKNNIDKITEEYRTKNINIIININNSIKKFKYDSNNKKFEFPDNIAINYQQMKTIIDEKYIEKFNLPIILKDILDNLKIKLGNIFNKIKINVKINDDIDDDEFVIEDDILFVRSNITNNYDEFKKILLFDYIVYLMNMNRLENKNNIKILKNYMLKNI